MLRRLVFSGLCIVTWFGSFAGQGQAGEKPTAPEQVRFFETSIRPLLVTQCQKCHGVKKQEGNLRLDSREGLLKGGKWVVTSVVH